MIKSAIALMVSDIQSIVDFSFFGFISRSTHFQETFISFLTIKFYLFSGVKPKT